jgi:TRAP-type C4-dicarboxylate transport system permease small subunit
MVFIVFFALAQTQAERGHIRVEALLTRLPAKVRAILDIAACLAGILLYGLIVWKCGKWAWESWQLREYTSGIINVPLYPSKFALVAGSGLFCLRFVRDIFQQVRELGKST